MRNPEKLTAGKAPHSPVALENCTLARAIGAVGDTWTLMILREATFGVGRFSEMQADLGIPRAVLSGRLRKLSELGILGPPEGLGRGYVLTNRGRALLPALLALAGWAAEWLPGGPSPLSITHQDCGAEVGGTLVCARGHIIEPADVSIG